jgi:hypothetical protein
VAPAWPLQWSSADRPGDRVSFRPRVREFLSGGFEKCLLMKGSVRSGGYLRPWPDRGSRAAFGASFGKSAHSISTTVPSANGRSDRATRIVREGLPPEWDGKAKIDDVTHVDLR